MARARLLKAEFFEDEKLNALPFGARLLYEALWCLADREGRLEDRPTRVAAFAFPPMGHEKLQAQARRAVPAWIDALVDADCLQRYEVDGEPYLLIRKWEKHQRVHPNEPKSSLPQPLETIGNQRNPKVTNVAGSGKRSGSGSRSGKRSKAEAETREGSRAGPPAPDIEPDDRRFSREYVRKHQEAHAMAPPSPATQQAARELETDFGTGPCVEAATARGWDKHPNYLREYLNDHPTGKEHRNARHTAREPERSTGTTDSLDELDRVPVYNGGA